MTTVTPYGLLARLGATALHQAAVADHVTHDLAFDREHEPLGGLGR